MTQEIVDKVIKIVHEESCESLDKITLSTTFAELDIDSLDFLCILAEVRKNVGRVEETFVSRIETVGDLAAAVGVSLETV